MLELDPELGKVVTPIIGIIWLARSGVATAGGVRHVAVLLNFDFHFTAAAAAVCCGSRVRRNTLAYLFTRVSGC